MQCVNCQFENIPGMTHCVRCQAPLSFAEVVVAPPRASSWRLGTRLARRWHAAIEALRTLWRARPRRLGLSRTKVAWDAVAWSLIPGMGFIKFSSKRIGSFVLGGWLLMILLTLIGLGQAWSPWCLMAAVFVHSVSILAFLGFELAHHRMLMRALFGIAVFFGLRALIYNPACALASCFYVPLGIDGLAPGPIVSNGDAILYEGRWTRPGAFKRGDVVVYNIHRRAGHDGMVHEGMGLDRIIGVPGDRIQFRDDQILVNDQPLAENQRPLGRANIKFFDRPLVLSNHEYLILPSRIPVIAPRTAQIKLIMESISRVHIADIRGRVVLRLHPWSRFGRIE